MSSNSVYVITENNNIVSVVKSFDLAQKFTGINKKINGPYPLIEDSVKPFEFLQTNFTKDIQIKTDNVVKLWKEEEKPFEFSTKPFEFPTKPFDYSKEPNNWTNTMQFFDVKKTNTNNSSREYNFLTDPYFSSNLGLQMMDISD